VVLTEVESNRSSPVFGGVEAGQLRIREHFTLKPNCGSVYKIGNQGYDSLEKEIMGVSVEGRAGGQTNRWMS